MTDRTNENNAGLLRTMRQIDDRLRQTEVGEVLRYATGTFTPIWVGTLTAGTWTYSIQTGFYTRIGNRCIFHLSMYAATRPVAPTGNSLVSGLPFTAISTAQSHAPVTVDSIDAITVTGTTLQLSARVAPGTSFIELIENLGTAPVTAALHACANLGVTAGLRMSGSYIIA